MERIGIIGVGEIGTAIVDGLCDGTDPAPRVFLSPRGAEAAAALAARHTGVTVCTDNQEVVDRSDLVVLALRRRDRHAAAAGLHVPDDRVLVNLIPGVSAAELTTLLGTRAETVRAIPLPTVRQRRSVTVTWPSHPRVDAFFDRLGGALPVAQEADFDIFSTVTGSLSIHYHYLMTLASWVSEHGVPAADAERYLRGLFAGIGRSLDDRSRSLTDLAVNHETPGGSNERVRTAWFTEDNVAALRGTLDSLLADLRRG